MRHAPACTRPSWAAFLLALSLLGAGAAHAASTPEVGDVYVAGGDVRTGGPIQGDFGAAGGKVSLDEPVAGDAWLVGGAVEVHGPVRNALHIAAGEALVDGVVGGNMIAAGGKVTLGSDTVVGGTARLYGGRVTMEGRIDGGLHASGRRVTINGEVRGDVDVRAENLELGPDARIGGTLRYSSRNELRKAEGATVGSVVRKRVPRDGDDDVFVSGSWDVPSPWRIGGLVSALSLLVSGAVFLFLVPRYGAQAADRLGEGPLGALTLGVVFAIAVPIVAVLLFITLLGIPLGLLLLLAYPVMLLAGFLVAVLAIGRRIASALRKPQPVGFARSLGWFALALLLVMLASLLPGVGGVALALLVLGGTGAAVIELQRRRKGGGTAAHGQPAGAGLA